MNHVIDLLVNDIFRLLTNYLIIGVTNGLNFFHPYVIILLTNNLVIRLTNDFIYLPINIF